jgi:hypothetical protein
MYVCVYVSTFFIILEAPHIEKPADDALHGHATVHTDVCMYVCMYVCILLIQAHTLRQCMYACMYTHTHILPEYSSPLDPNANMASMYAFLYVYTQTHTHTHTHTHIYQPEYTSPP